MLPKVYKIMKSLSQTQYNLLLFTVVALWGSLYVDNRVILGYMPVLWLLFFRFAISAAVLIPITIQRGFCSRSGRTGRVFCWWAAWDILLPTHCSRSARALPMPALPAC